MIAEEVPVFTGHVRLRKDVVLSSEATFVRSASCPGGEGRPLTLKEMLRYQACDDKKCYPPTQVPLSWELTLYQLDFERPAEENQRLQ